MSTSPHLDDRRQSEAIAPSGSYGGATLRPPASPAIAAQPTVHARRDTQARAAGAKGAIRAPLRRWHPRRHLIARGVTPGGLEQADGVPSGPALVKKLAIDLYLPRSALLAWPTTGCALFDSLASRC
jgi:hypothetical protein